jgi:transcription initiation factor IIE alpha subunit
MFCLALGKIVQKDENHSTKSYRYAALDLGQRTVQAVLKREHRKIIKEIKTRKQADTNLQFLKGTHANVGRF